MDGAEGRPRPRLDVEAADLLGAGIDERVGRPVPEDIFGRGRPLVVGRGIRLGGGINDGSCSVISNWISGVGVSAFGAETAGVASGVSTSMLSWEDCISA